MTLTAGDWPYVSSASLRGWFPWPTVWDPTLAFGTKVFYGAYEFPVNAAEGALATLGVTWPLLEKAFYFLPFAFLLPAGAWLFAQDLLGSRRWALVSAVLYATSTYFLTFTIRGALYIGMAQALAPIVLMAFRRAAKKPSIRGTVVVAALLAVQAAYELRITYLTVGMCLAYLLLLGLTEPTLQLVLRRAAFGGSSLAILAGLQAYWIVPFLTYRGDRGLPIASTPFAAFMQLTHGLSGVSPAWTGGAPATFGSIPVSPTFFIFPILAFVPLARRRIRTDYLWLSMCALGAAFLIKQTNPPAGQVYDWLFQHWPGWNLFREASKLFFVVAISYAILIPVGIRALWERTSTRPLRNALSRSFVVCAVVVLFVLTMYSVVPLQTGALGFTSRPQPMPDGFGLAAQMIDTDAGFGSVLWLGGPVANRPNEAYRGDIYPITSERHPLVLLDGATYNNDPLVQFCVNPAVVFCYLKTPLFPFLINRLGAAYVVAPAGSDVGSLPPGTDFRQLLKMLTDALGAPTVLGTGNYQIAVWHVGSSLQPIIEAPAVTVLNASTRATTLALPAIETLNLPVIYNVSNTKVPGESVQVEIGSNGDYVVTNANQFILLAHTSTAALAISDGGPAHVLPRGGAGAPGWSWFGPVRFDPGVHHLVAADGVSLGPLILWSDLADDILNGRAPFVTNVAGSGGRESTGVVTDGARQWVEVRSTFDPGWQGASVTYHAIGDGLFNLFLIARSARFVQLTFSTSPWELTGRLITLAAASLVAVCLLITGMRTRDPGDRARQYVEPQRTMPSNGVSPTALSTAFSTASWLAIAGMSLIVIGAVVETAISPGPGWLVRATTEFAAFYPGGSSALVLRCLTIAMIVLGSSILVHTGTLGASFALKGRTRR